MVSILSVVLLHRRLPCVSLSSLPAFECLLFRVNTSSWLDIDWYGRSVFLNTAHGHVFANWIWRYFLCVSIGWFQGSGLVISSPDLQNGTRGTRFNRETSWYLLFVHNVHTKQTNKLEPLDLSWFIYISWSQNYWMIGFVFFVWSGGGGCRCRFLKSCILCSDGRCCFSSALTAVVLDHDLAAAGLLIQRLSWELRISEGPITLC